MRKMVRPQKLSSSQSGGASGLSQLMFVLCGSVVLMTLTTDLNLNVSGLTAQQHICQPLTTKILIELLQSWVLSAQQMVRLVQMALGLMPTTTKHAFRQVSAQLTLSSSIKLK